MAFSPFAGLDAVQCVPPRGACAAHDAAWHASSEANLKRLLESRVAEGRTQRVAALIPGRFFVGGLSDAVDVDTLKGLRITHVLSTMGAVPNYLTRVAAAGPLVVTSLNAVDSETFPILKLFSQKVKTWIDTALSHPGHVVLIHCAAGCNRSVALGVAYAVDASPDLLEKAPHCRRERLALLLDRLTAERPYILSNDGFLAQLLAMPCGGPIACAGDAASTAGQGGVACATGGEVDAVDEWKRVAFDDT